MTLDDRPDVGAPTASRRTGLDPHGQPPADLPSVDGRLASPQVVGVDRPGPRPNAPAPVALFYHRHAAAVLGYFARHGVGPAHAGRLTERTFARAERARDAADGPDDADPRSWLLELAAATLGEDRRPETERAVGGPRPTEPPRPFG